MVGTCPKCGAALHADSVFCEVCGERVVSEECPRCGASLESGSVRCGSCGSALMRCPSCNAPNTLDSAFCVSCGKPIAASPGRPSAPEPPRPQQVPVSQPMPLRHAYREGDDDDDPTMLSKMVTLTPDEAHQGCRKTVRTRRGETVEVVVPPYTHAGSHVDIDGYGLPDGMGGRGKLHVTFFIAR